MTKSDEARTAVPVFPNPYTIHATKPRGRLAKLLATGGAEIVPIDGEPDIDRYIISDRLAIERRTGSSFLMGIMDKTLFTSARTLREHYRLPVFILEGEVNYAYRGFDPQAVRGALSSMMLEYELNVIQTPDMNETAHMIAMMVRHEIDGIPEISVVPKRKASSLADQQRRVIEMLPGCGRVIARELLQRFESIDGIVRATEKALQTVVGLGAKKAQHIRQVLTADYEAIDTEKQLEDAIEFDHSLLFQQPVTLLSRQHFIFDDDQDRHIVDMVFHDASAKELILVELKRGMLHPWHCDQLRRYLDRATASPLLQGYLETGCTLRGVLASPSPGGMKARARDMQVVGVDEKRAIAALKKCRRMSHRDDSLAG
jgi:ERCC4-type nuclease